MTELQMFSGGTTTVLPKQERTQPRGTLAAAMDANVTDAPGRASISRGQHASGSGLISFSMPVSRATVDRAVLDELYQDRRRLNRERRAGRISESSLVFLRSIEQEIDVRERAMTVTRRSSNDGIWDKIDALASKTLEINAAIERAKKP